MAFDAGTLQQELNGVIRKLGEARAVMKAMPITGDLSLKPRLVNLLGEAVDLASAVTGEKVEPEPEPIEETMVIGKGDVGEVSIGEES